MESNMQQLRSHAKSHSPQLPRWNGVLDWLWLSHCVTPEAQKAEENNHQGVIERKTNLVSIPHMISFLYSMQ